MDNAVEKRLTFDEFVDWSAAHPEAGRCELVDGRIVGMAPERAGHALRKAAVWRALDDAIAAAGLSCQAFPDGMTVQIDQTTAYEPDAVVHCGNPVPGDAITVPNPVIIVEVASPSTSGLDAGVKLDDYFRLPSVSHYLLVRTDRPVLIHHRRRADETIETRIIREGTVLLDPPGLMLDLGFLSA